MFYVGMAVVGLAATLIGFLKTFIVPTYHGTFKAPIVIHIHGALAFSWIILFFTQTTLIQLNKFRFHKQLGFAGIGLAISVAITMIPAGIFQVENDLRKGLGETAVSGMLGTCTSAIIFLSLVIAGSILRKDHEVHKRLMLLATIFVLWPAWFRFRHYFPSVPRPDIWFGLILADSLIIISIIRDKIITGRVHPVFGIVGTCLILENIFEVSAFDSPAWRILASLIYTSLT